MTHPIYAGYDPNAKNGAFNKKKFKITKNIHNIKAYEK